MDSQLNMKSRALGKDEVLTLLDLISKHKVITTRATNATNNKLKEEAWKAIAQEFSAMAGEMRRPEQLRLKWENLKKAARKRNALIRQNNIKTGGGKAYIPPDEALERVASILGATCNGFTVEFGGDQEDGGSGNSSALVEVIDFGPLPEPCEINNALVLEGDGGDRNNILPGLESKAENPKTPKTFLFNTPKTTVNKRRKLSEEVQQARREKDLALAAYFQAKADNIQLQNIKLKLEIQKLCNDHDQTPL